MKVYVVTNHSGDSVVFDSLEGALDDIEMQVVDEVGCFVSIEVDEMTREEYADLQERGE